MNDVCYLIELSCSNLPSLLLSATSLCSLLEFGTSNVEQQTPQPKAMWITRCDKVKMKALTSWAIIQLEEPKQVFVQKTRNLLFTIDLNKFSLKCSVCEDARFVVTEMWVWCQVINRFSWHVYSANWCRKDRRVSIWWWNALHWRLE